MNCNDIVSVAAFGLYKEHVDCCEGFVVVVVVVDVAINRVESLAVCVCASLSLRGDHPVRA
jgi:hypothetical protein